MNKICNFCKNREYSDDQKCFICIEGHHKTHDNGQTYQVGASCIHDNYLDDDFKPISDVTKQEKLLLMEKVTLTDHNRLLKQQVNELKRRLTSINL